MEGRRDNDVLLIVTGIRGVIVFDKRSTTKGSGGNGEGGDHCTYEATEARSGIIAARLPFNGAPACRVDSKREEQGAGGWRKSQKEVKTVGDSRDKSAWAHRKSDGTEVKNGE